MVLSTKQLALVLLLLRPLLLLPRLRGTLTARREKANRRVVAVLCQTRGSVTNSGASSISNAHTRPARGPCPL